MAGTIVSTEELFQGKQTLSTEELFSQQKPIVTTDELFNQGPKISGPALPSMPSDKPAQVPPPMNQVKVYGMVEGMPAHLAAALKKAAIDYDRGMSDAPLKEPAISITDTLGEAYKHIEPNVADIIRDTSSFAMYLAKESYKYGINTVKDINDTYKFALTQHPGAKIPELRAGKQLEPLKELPKILYTAAAGEVERAKDIGLDHYLNNFVKERPVDALLITNAIRAGMGVGAKVTLQTAKKVAKKGTKFADSVDDILSKERSPLVYDLPYVKVMDVPKGEQFLAAIKLSNGKVYSGTTHGEIFDKLNMRQRKMIVDADGFEAAGKFFTREEANLAARTWSGKKLSPEEIDATDIVGKYGSSVKVPKTAKAIKFERQYSQDPITKYMYQKSFDKVLDKYPRLKKSLTEYKAGKYLTELRKTYDRANVEQRIKLHSEIDSMLGTLTDDELKVMVPYLEGRASLLGNASDEFQKFEGWYRGLMKKGEDDLVSRGIVGDDRVNEIIYGPLMKSTGKTLEEVKDEFGDFTPAYVHQMHTEYPKKLSVEFADTTGKRYKPGILKKRKFGEGYSENLKEVLPKWGSEYIKFKNTEAFIKDMTDNFGVAVNIKDVKQVHGGLKVGDNVYKDYRIVAPDGYLRFFRGKVDFQKEVAKRLDSMDFDEAIADVVSETFKAAPDNIRYKEYLSAAKNQTVYLVPEEVAKKLESWANPLVSQSFQNFVKIAYDKPVNLWKDSVLALTPRWIKNNVIGDIMFNTMEGVGPQSYGRAFSGQYDKLIPDELLKASFANVMKYNPKLGSAAKSTVGQLIQKLENTKAVKGIAKVKDAGYAINTAFEQPFVRSLYIKLARDKAKGLLKKQGQPVNDKSILYKMEEIKNSKSLSQPLINKVKETLPVFDLTGNVERKVLKRMAPFYNWYKFMAQYGAKLPVNHPFKTVGARGLGALSEIEREKAFSQAFPFMESYIKENGIPDRYNNLWPISDPDEEGEALFFNARGMNPFTTIEDFVEGDVVNMMSPIIKLAIERSTGKEAFTGRDFQTAEKGEGKFREFDKEKPPLGDHILKQFPQYTLLKQVLVPARQWDDGTLFNPKPKLDKITGEYKYPIKNIDKILNYMGVDRKTVNIEKSWQSFQKNRQRAIGETFQKKQSQFEKHLTADEIKELFQYIKSKPEQWNKILDDIKMNERQKIKMQKRKMKKVRGQ